VAIITLNLAGIGEAGDVTVCIAVVVVYTIAGDVVGYIGEAGEGLVGVAGLGPGILMNIIRPIIMITTSTIATRYKVFLKAKRYHL